VVPEGLDTDRFGTFTRGVARSGSMEEAATAKADAAMTASGLGLGLASEGSYGPHPAMPFMPGGHELLVFIDRSRNLTITEHVVTAQVTFGHTTVTALDALQPFLQRVGFPDQWLVLRPADRPDGTSGMTKGVADEAQLAAAFAAARNRSATGEVLVETDMRAFANPQRVRTMALLARRLGARLARHCPECDTPGFGGDRPVAGLPCADCGTPTVLPLAVERTCLHCGYRVQSPSRELAADPSSCPCCNP
jgi:hypothetical protein